MCVCRGVSGAGHGNLPPQDLAHQTCGERRDMSHPHTHPSFQRRPLIEMGGPRYEKGSYLGPQADNTEPAQAVIGTFWDAVNPCDAHGPARLDVPTGPACESQVCEGMGVTMFLWWASHSPLTQTRVVSPARPQGYKTQARGV